MEEEALESFVRRGAKEEPVEIMAAEIKDAILAGQHIYIEYAVVKDDIAVSSAVVKGKIDVQDTRFEGKIDIKDTRFWGNINITDNVTFCGKVTFSRCTFDGRIAIKESVFKNDADFYSSEFHSDAGFENVTFKGNAQFRDASFNARAFFLSVMFMADADFESTAFRGYVDFERSIFDGYYVSFRNVFFGVSASFAGVFVKQPADFKDVTYIENTFCRVLWNDIAHPIFWRIAWLLLLGRWERIWKRIRKCELSFTDFYRLSTTTLDESSNQRLSRYINDEQWIKSWRTKSWLRYPIFVIWQVTSHCGRNFGLWAFWALLMVTLFGFVYAEYTVPSQLPPLLENLLVHMNPKLDISPDDRIPTPFTPYYFSIVAFTTLGLGDVTPLNLAGEICLAVEVVIGYLMLGILITIAGHRFTRRS